MRALLVLFTLACATTACRGQVPHPPLPEPAPPAPESPRPPAPTTTAAVPRAAGPRIVFLGDSLSAGMGLAVDDAFPARLGKALAEHGLPADIVNAGVSGDTTAGGLRRVDWVLSQKPDILVLELGANDMFRGMPPADVDTNLRAIVAKAQGAGATVLLLGMRANPTLGPDYVAAFDAIYPKIAQDMHVALVPFVLDGVAGDAALNQADGIHPTAEGHARITTLVLPALEPLVRGRE